MFLNFLYLFTFIFTNIVSSVENKSLDEYLKLLDKFPVLKQQGKHSKGEFEIILDPSIISKISREEYLKLINKNISPTQAHEWSLAGVIQSDPYLLWIRDPVLFPNGSTGLFKRIVWRCTLNNQKPIAILPITKEGKVCLIRIWRHAVGNWEFEIPRGAPQTNENSIETAKRELQEETGFISDNIIELGAINPDSGILSNSVAVFLCIGSVKTIPDRDENELISNVHYFKIEEINEGIKKGYLQHSENGVNHITTLRDPFLTYALYQAKIRNLIN